MRIHVALRLQCRHRTAAAAPASPVVMDPAPPVVIDLDLGTDMDTDVGTGMGTGMSTGKGMGMACGTRVPNLSVRGAGLLSRLLE